MRNCIHDNIVFITTLYKEMFSVKVLLVIMAEAAQSRVKYIDYYIKTKDYCAHWKELGVLLGIEIPELEVIEADNLKKSTDCHMKMLDFWLRNIDPENPKEQLDNALRRLKKKYPNGEWYCAHMWLAARKQSFSIS